MSRPLGLTLVVLALLACGDGTPDGGPDAAGKPLVMTTFYPTVYFTRRIAGDLVTVACPVPEDEDAIFWQPDEETIGRYQQADMIVINGAQFEKWVLTTSLPPAKVVDTAKPFEKDFVRFEHAVTHTHGPAGEHAHEGIDGHTWLDPVNAKIQAGEIHKALVRLMPAQEETLDAGFAALVADLDGLDAKFRALPGTPPLLASHPAYNYLAKRYGWKIVNLDLDPETMPADEVFAQVKKTLETHPAKFLLWESDPTAEIATRFRDELGITSVTVSPCEMMTARELVGREDYLTKMTRNLVVLKSVFSAGE
ncbi:MAG: zinc ABC transporter substrate-binding protein [Planctomycetota bacterium]